MNTARVLPTVVIELPVSQWLGLIKDQFKDHPDVEKIVALCLMIFGSKTKATIDRADDVLKKALEDLHISCS